MAIAAPTEYGGYEYSFVNDPPDHCLCKICHHPSRDAYMTGPCCEGLTICKSCLDYWQITAGNMKCPVCRKEEGGFSKNYPIQREIRSLHIYCSNKEKGCEWQGELNNINNHFGNSDGCHYEEVKCSNECGKMIQRQYLTSHVETECPRREVNCQYCHDTGEHQFIEGQHKEECPKLPLPCPNNCEVGSVPREDMEAHRKECPLEMIQCEYYSVGCEVRMARKDQKEHRREKVEDHLTMTKHKLTDTNCQLTDTNNKLANTQEKLTNTITTLASTKRKLIDTNHRLSIALQRISTLEILLYLATNAAVAKPSNCAMVLESSVGWADKLVTMAMMSKSGDQSCPVVFKLSEYNIKKENELQPIWYSDPFYTHNKGYKMCLGVYAAGNGLGRGTHLSVLMFLMKGPHDDELTWPLRGRKFEIKLLNQISDSEHHSCILGYDYTGICRVTEGNRSNGRGRNRYISNEDLNKITPTCQFLRDECLFFQLSKL